MKDAVGCWITHLIRRQGAQGPLCSAFLHLLVAGAKDYYKKTAQCNGGEILEWQAHASLQLTC